VSQAHRLERLESLDDPRLSPYRCLKDKSLRAEGLFIAEGRVVIDACLSRLHCPLESMLLSTSQVGSAADLIERLPADREAYVLPQTLMNQLVGFDIHRGLLAAGRRPAPRTSARLLAEMAPGPATVLVCEALRNTDNAGACFRNAAAFGAAALLFDDASCDPLYRRAIRVSAGHALRLPWSHGDTTEALLESLSINGFVSVALGLGDDAAPLRLDEPLAPRLALWLGSEGSGLSERAWRGCGLRRRIPIAPGVDSLNVATAGAIALFAVGSRLPRGAAGSTQSSSEP
jgi:tRNA G18 (ribose-2'-O)-methylase SpoU